MATGDKKYLLIATIKQVHQEKNIIMTTGN
jgi:hypothetical protein